MAITVRFGWLVRTADDGWYVDELHNGKLVKSTGPMPSEILAHRHARFMKTALDEHLATRWSRA